MSGHGRQEYKENLREEKVDRKDKSRFRTVVHAPIEEDLGMSSEAMNELQGKLKLKKSKSLNRKPQKQNTMQMLSPVGQDEDLRRTDAAVYSPSAQKLQTSQASQHSIAATAKLQKKLIEKDA